MATAQPTPLRTVMIDSGQLTAQAEHSMQASGSAMTALFVDDACLLVLDLPHPLRTHRFAHPTPCALFVIYLQSCDILDVFHDPPPDRMKTPTPHVTRPTTNAPAWSGTATFISFSTPLNEV